jgi:hypothetical protein
VSYEDDASGAAEALLALLQGAAILDERETESANTSTSGA